MFDQLLSLRKMFVQAKPLAFLSLAILLGSPVCFAQQQTSVVGNFTGTLGPLHLKLHIVADQRKLTGTIDSPDQGSLGIPCADFHLDGQTLSFAVPAVHGKWDGTVSADGKLLTGTWNQGQPMPLEFTRDTFQAASKPSPVDGIWLGTLNAGGTPLRVQVTVKSDVTGREYCTADSPDQGAMGLACANEQFAAPHFFFDVPSVKAHWEGNLSSDGNALDGTLTQGAPLPLNFTRQLKAIVLPPPSPVHYDPALPPVAAADLQAVLDKDLAGAIQSGELAPATSGGVSIAVIEHGERHIFSYGTAKPDSIFEIGSISKTFTGLILSQLVEQGKVHFDDPVRTLLPPGAIEKPSGPEITLLDLATQHSGLPRMPDNFHPADPANPYADYRAADLYAYLAKRGVAKPANAGFLYSNLGFGLLGQALAAHEGMTYPALLAQQVTGPLGLHDTVVTLTPEQQARFIQGHDAQHRPAHAWDLDALAGAGAIRSTAGDMVTYLQAQLHPEALKPGDSKAAATLAAAITQQHQLRADVGPGTRIALAWLYEEETGNYWHNGGTGGFSSYSFFNPKGDYAAVVLFNTTLSPTGGSFADRLGLHISQRLAGKPAISLGN